MKLTGRIHTAAYGIALAMLMFTYVTLASAKTSVKTATTATLDKAQNYSWLVSFYNDGEAYEK
jgi:hypothetical protein